MIADLTTPLRDAAYLAFEDGTNDYTTAPKAAYVLEAQAARIAELEAALHDMAKHIWRGDWDKLKPETRALLGEKQ